MNSIFETDIKDQLLLRIDGLTAHSTARWGKMNVAQMLAHCANALELAMGNVKPKRQLIGKWIGWMFKGSYTSKRPFAKNVPTIKGGAVEGECDFETEKTRLKERLQYMYSQGLGICTDHPHPVLGRFTPEAWGMGMYKHLDHHLRQFGA